MELVSRLRAAPRVATLVAFVCVAAQRVSAQSIGRLVIDHARTSAGDAWAVWTAPLHGGGRDWLTAVGVVGVAAAVSPFDDNIDRWAVGQRDDGTWHFLRPFREGGDAFSGRTVAPFAIGALGVALITKSDGMLEGISGCATSYGAATAVRDFVVYPLVSRTRPDSGRGVQPAPATQGDQYHFTVPGTGDWGRHALPGGHVSNITSCVGFFVSRYKLGPFAVAPWAAVGAVAMARTLDRRHWASDQVVGAFLGYAVGREVALRSLRRTENASARRSGEHDEDGSFYFAPGVDGARVGWRRAF